MPELNNLNSKSFENLKQDGVKNPAPKTSKKSNILKNFKVKDFNPKTPEKFNTPEKDTLSLSGKKKDKKKFLKVALAALGAASAIAALAFIGSKAKKPGSLFGGFDNSKFLEHPPTIPELDNKTLEIIKDVKLNMGFDENLSSDKLKNFIETNFPSGNEVYNTVKDSKTKIHALNIIKGLQNDNKLASGYIFEKEHLTEFLSNIKNGDEKDFENFAKFFSTLQNNKECSFGCSIKNFQKLWNNKDNITRTYSVLQIFDDKLPQNKQDSFSDWKSWFLDYHKDVNSKDVVKFLSSLRKGTVDKSYNFMYQVDKLIKDKNIDLKQMTKFYDSLKPEVLSKVYINDLPEFTQVEGMNLKEVSKFLNNIPQEDLGKMWSTNNLISYANFREFLNVSNINELDMAQKKKLLQKLVKNNSSSFGGSKFSKIIPKNQEEYCSLLQKLSRSIGVDTVPLSPQKIKEFNGVIQSLGKNIKGVDLNNAEIGMKISRQDFMQKAEGTIKNLSEIEKRKVMDYFGFEIKDGKLKGYPININNGKKLAEIKDNKTKAAVEKLRPVVEEFVNPASNPITVSGANKAFEADLNKLLETMPELRSIIGKPQHETHSFTLDIHTLKVLQNVCSNPKFENLNVEDKKIISIASLLHDITKLEGSRDPMHPMESAFDAYYIIQKLNLPEDEQLKIYELIKSHNWLQRLNDPRQKDIVENIAQDIAFDARHTNTFELAKILCEADLKSVKKDASFFDYHKKTLEDMSKKVDGYLQHIKETQIFLPQTKIPKASKIQGGVEKTADGITNTVIYIDKAQEDLSIYGFEKGTTKTNMKNLVHALDHQEQMSKFDTFSIIDSEALLSTSYMNPKEYRVFRKQGLILNVNSNDIHAGYYQDFGTGYSKEIELLKQDYLFKNTRNKSGQENMWRSDRTEYREYIPKLFKQKMNVSNEEYTEMMAKIQSCSSITDVEKIDKDLAKTMQEIFDDMDAGKRRGNRAYNEMLVSRPRIQGVFAYDKKYEEIPEFLRKYAQENDFPILIFGTPKN